MTNMGHMVIEMEKWTREDFDRYFEKVTGAVSPDDPKERKRLTIVRAGTELFIQQGYRKTSVEEIAARAGVAKGTVYLYFQNKAQILLHAIIEEKKRYVHHIEPVLRPETPPRERLRTWLGLMFALPSQMPLVSKLLSGDREILTALDEVMAEVPHDMRGLSLDFIGGLVDGAASPHGWNRVEVEDRARVLMALSYFSGLIAEERVRGGLSVERFATILSDMIVDGIGPSRAGRGGSDPAGGQP